MQGNSPKYSRSILQQFPFEWKSTIYKYTHIYKYVCIYKSNIHKYTCIYKYIHTYVDISRKLYRKEWIIFIAWFGFGGFFFPSGHQYLMHVFFNFHAPWIKRNKSTFLKQWSAWVLPLSCYKWIYQDRRHCDIENACRLQSAMLWVCWLLSLFSITLAAFFFLPVLAGNSL